LNITNPGVYQFSTTSSDGSRMVLDNVVVVNNDGIHKAHEVQGDEQTLTAGPKRVTVTYFDFTGPDTLVVKYKGPDTGDEWKEIPDEVLKSGELPVTKSMLVTAYPNPSGHNDVNLVVQSLDNTPLYINLLDNLGRTVYATQINASDFWQGIKFTPPDLSNGIYLITIRQNQSTGQCKLAIRQ